VNETIKYWAGKRKRRQSAQIKEIIKFGNVEIFKVTKRTKMDWVKKEDIASNLDPNERRDKTSGEFREFVQILASETEKAMDQESLPSDGQGNAQIHPAQNGMAERETVRVWRDGSEWPADLFPEVASSRRPAPLQRPREENAPAGGILDSGLQAGASLDRSESSGSKTNGAHPPKLEFTAEETKRFEKRWADTLKKRVWRGIRSGRSLYMFSLTIQNRAIANDTKFFIRLASEIQHGLAARKTKKGTK
jgi:hypothetical protein